MATPSPNTHPSSRRPPPQYFLAGANIVIASAGPESEGTIETRFGKIRSRSSALLRHTTNDAEAIYSEWERKHPNVPDDLRVLLIDPTIGAVESAIVDMSSRLHHEYHNALGLDLFFAGHGAAGTGNLILKDGLLSATRFLSLQAKDVGGRSGVRRIGVSLDSCYSGAFLIDMAIRAYEDFEGFRVDGSLASCLPNEESYEMTILGHGVFTYTCLYHGNRHVDKDRFNQAILANDSTEIAKALQGLVSMTGGSATAFLTEGRQFSLIMNKHTIDVQGGLAGVDLVDTSNVAELVEQLTMFKRNSPPLRSV